MKKFFSASDGIFSGIKISEKFVVTLSFTIILAGSALFLSLFGKSVFFYQENNSLFLFSADYFETYKAYPGGLLIYAGTFFTQFYYHPVFGTLIVSVLLLLLSLILYKIKTHLGIRGPLSVLLILVPSCILLLLQTYHQFYIFYIFGYMIVSIAFFVTIVTKSRISIIVISSLFPLLFFLAGSFAFLYMGMVLLYVFITEKGNKRIFILSITAATASLTFFLFREMIFLQPANRILLYPLFQNFTGAMMPFIYMLSGFFILLPLFIKVPASTDNETKHRNLYSLFTVITVLIIEILLLSGLYDSSFSGIMKLEKMVYERNWNGVIKQQEKKQATDIISEYYFNLALSEKNQLCERLFYAPQKYGTMALTLSSDNSQLYRSIYYYYCIGLTSEAHHRAYELMVQHGYTPETIKMLVKTELIKGNYKVAARYLNILNNTIYYKRWAERYHEMIINPALIQSDPELSEKISLLPKNDFFIIPDDAKTIDLFLKENPDNKRAFEYKIAQLMLGKDLLAVVNELAGLKAAGYTSVPRAIEETVVQYYSVTQALPDLGGLKVNPETARRFEQYKSVLSSCMGKKSLVETKMKKTEKNTFWYYLHFSVLNTDFHKGKPENYYLY